MGDMPGSSPSCESPTWTDPNAYYTCYAGSYKKWMWGLFGFFAGSITLGLIARWFRTRGRWAMREEPRNGQGQHYIKRWFGWQKLENYTRDIERHKEIKAIIRHTFQWKTTTRDYCSSLIWDPGRKLWKEQQERRNQTWIKYLPNWMRSYEPRFGEIHRRIMSECHLPGCKTDDQRARRNLLSAAEQGLIARCLNSFSTRRKQKTVFNSTQRAHIPNFTVRHYLSASVSRKIVPYERDAAKASSISHLANLSEESREVEAIDLQEESNDSGTDTHSATFWDIPSPMLGVSSSTSTTRRHKLRSTATSSWHTKSEETSRAVRHQLLVDKPSVATPAQENNTTQTLSMLARLPEANRASLIHRLDGTSSNEVTQEHDTFVSDGGSIFVIKTRPKHCKPLEQREHPVNRSSGSLGRTWPSQSENHVLAQLSRSNSVQPRGIPGDVDGEPGTGGIENQKVTSSVTSNRESAMYIDISQYEAEDQLDRDDNNSLHETSASDGDASRSASDTSSVSHTYQLRYKKSNMMEDQKFQVTVDEKYASSSSYSCSPTIVNTSSQVSSVDTRPFLEETGKRARARGLGRFASSIIGNPSLHNLRTAIKKQRQSSQSTYLRQESLISTHDFCNQNIRTFAGQVSPRSQRGKLRQQRSKKSPSIVPETLVMTSPCQIVRCAETPLAPKKRAFRSPGFQRAMSAWNIRRRESRNPATLYPHA